MYSILTYIWVIYGANVAKYSIHGAKIGQSIYTVCNIITYNTYIYHHMYIYRVLRVWEVNQTPRAFRSGVKNITGLTCRPWRVNESRSMPLGPMVQAR